MRATFTFATQVNADPPADRCEQVCLTANTAEDTHALTALARLFTAGKAATEVCRRLARVKEVESLVASLRADVGEQEDELNDHVARIECLEAQVSAQAEELAANVGIGGDA